MPAEPFIDTDRFVQARLRKGWSQAELGRRTGLDQGTISKIEKGVTRSPEHETARRIADQLGVTVDWLLGREDFNVIGPVDDIAGSIPRRPVFLWGACGDPLSQDGAPDPVRHERPPIEASRLLGKRGFGVLVRGNSMTRRRINDGDLVWINPDLPAKENKPVLAEFEDSEGERGMVVKVYRIALGGTPVLTSDGDEGDQIVLGAGFRVIGPVVWVSPSGYAPD